MKKIVRRNHIRENFRANLIMEKKYTAGDAVGDAADMLIPGVSAYKNFAKGDVGAGLFDLGLDAAGILAGAFSGGTGYLGVKGVGAAIKGGSKLAKIADAATKAAKFVPKARTVPTLAKGKGKGKFGPWGTAQRRATVQRKNSGSKGNRPKDRNASDLADFALGAGMGGTLGGGGGTSQPLSILGKERPQTGFRNQYQGIDPYRSGELRQSVPFYDTTPVGGVMSRRAMMGGGMGRIPPSSLPEGKVYAQLKEMVSNSIKTKEINNILVTQDMAKNIVNLHEALNTDNKKILEKNIQSKDGFFEVLDFSVRN